MFLRLLPKVKVACRCGLRASAGSGGASDPDMAIILATASLSYSVVAFTHECSSGTKVKGAPRFDSCNKQGSQPSLPSDARMPSTVLGLLGRSLGSSGSGQQIQWSSWAGVFGRCSTTGPLSTGRRKKVYFYIGSSLEVGGGSVYCYFYTSY